MIKWIDPREREAIAPEVSCPPPATVKPAAAEPPPAEHLVLIDSNGGQRDLTTGETGEVVRDLVLDQWRIVSITATALGALILFRTTGIPPATNGPLRWL